MQNFGYYSNIDSTNEIISKYKCNNIKQAIEYFSKLKKIPVNKFIKLYTVTNEL